VCKKADGQTCGTNTECANNTCCTGICRNPDDDVNHCGGCSITCSNANGSTSCTAGVCAPVCDSDHESCDLNNNNGCEQSTRTLNHCGGCNLFCSRFNATATCATEACAILACNNGFSDCDLNDATGCETQLSLAANTCGSAVDLGSVSGDVGADALGPVQGHTSRWFKITVTENDNSIFSTSDLTVRAVLNVPTGMDYDLFAYSACGDLVQVSASGVGALESVLVTVNDVIGFNNGFDLWLEVRFVSGTQCTNWALSVQGNPL